MGKWFFLFLLMFAGIQVSGQAFMDRHSTSKTDAWISCERSSSPNTARGSGHWMMLDLGDTYALSESHIWNLNTPDYEGAGFHDLVIDYSLDGQTWQEFGQYRLDHGNLSAFYEGEPGPDFGGLVVRYLLLTGVSNHGHSTCYGLGEMKVEAKLTPLSGTETPGLQVDMKISPNPSSDFVQLTLNNLPEDGLKFHLTDIFGRLVQKGDVVQTSTWIDVSYLNSGMYFVSIISPWGIKTKKLEIIR
jgi:hypothetical protein